MLQAGPPSLHYYCAVVLHSWIVLPPVGHSSNHVVNLQDNRAVFRFSIALLRLSFDSPSYNVKWLGLVSGMPRCYYSCTTSKPIHYHVLSDFKHQAPAFCTHVCNPEDKDSTPILKKSSKTAGRVT